MHTTENDVEEAIAPLAVPSKPPKPTALPTTQLWIILLVQGVEPVCGTVIYPFITRFIQETGITNGDAKKTGYYAGYLESLFFVAEASTVLFWGRASDVLGRRPIIVFGMAGLTLATLGFGFSRTFWAAVVSRTFQGVFNGNIGVARSVMGEILDSSNMTQGFSLLPLVWAGGFTIAPLIGGSLANIAERWPDAPALFKTFPYLLPCATASVFTFALFIWSLNSLKETLASKKPTQHHDDCSENAPLLEHSSPREYGSTNTDSPVPSGPEKRASVSLILTPSVMIPILNQVIYSLLDGSYGALLPLMFSSSISLGGIGLTPLQIGSILGIWSFVNIFVQMFVFSYLVRLLGLRKTYIACFGSFWVIMGSFPVMNMLARRSGCVDEWVWAVLLLSLVGRSMLFMAYSCLAIFIIEGTPHRSLLGTTNGLSQMVSSSMRAVGPSLASSLYSLSLEKNLIGGYFVYVLLLLLVACGTCASLFLPERRSVR